MDRRQYLGLTGASIAALLGGCSSTGSESTATATDTATETPTASPTATETSTPTETPTETATDTPASDPYNVDRTFLEFMREEYLFTGGQAQDIEDNYDASKAEPGTEGFGEDLLKQLDSIPDVGTGTDWSEAYKMARAAQYAAHEMHGLPIDPSQSDSVQVLPVPLVLSGTNQNGIDVHTNEGRTIMIPEYGETIPGNILYPGEEVGTLNEGRIESLTEHEGNKDSNFRWSHFDVVNQKKNNNFNAAAADWYHTQIGKLITGIYPAGQIPSQPQAWMTESGARLLDKRTVENYEGIDPYVDMREGFEDVEPGKIGRIFEENGEFAVQEDEPEAYRNDVYFAPEP